MKGGALQPTLLPQSSGTPAASARANQIANDNSQTRLLNAVGGKKRYYTGKKRHYKGGTQPVTIMPAAYTETGGTGQTVGANQRALAIAQNQGGANAAYDNKLGGSRRRRRGRKICTYKDKHSSHHRGKTHLRHRHSIHHKGCSSRRKK